MGRLSRHARFQAGGSLEYSGVGVTETVVVTLAQDSAILLILNTLNADVELYLPNEDGTFGSIIVPAKASPSFDFAAGDRPIAAGSIKVKHLGVAPTSGRISVLGVA